MIEVYSNSKIYVMCPPQTATGGPELLHQLVYKLSLQGFDISMYYYPAMENPVHENYLKYNCRFVTSIEDNPSNVLIIPEALLFRAGEFKHIRKCIWWLSIDNLFKAPLAPRELKIFKKLGWETLYRYCLIMGKVKGKFTYHLAQSYYAVDYLKKRGIHAGYLSDYLNAAYLDESRKIATFDKVPKVLYNPKKGYEFTQKIMAALPEVEWIPLIGLKPVEVAALLREAMLYIDFGEHPGKDRFPREAAIYRCCVITGKKGSSAYYEDVSIPDEYKIADKEANIPEIARMIRACLSEYNTRVSDFDVYRDKIYQEEHRFEKDLNTIFLKA